MPSLFRRRNAGTLADDGSGEPADTPQPAAEPEQTDTPSGRLPRGYTPSKKELGVATPKRPSPHTRRPGATPDPRTRKKRMTPEERQEAKETRRAKRREISEGMRRGDPRYLASRDQGPERALARDVVDSRRTVGTWFFGGALVVLLGSSSAIPGVVLVSNLLFLLLTVALAVDSVALCRRVKRLVQQRHPDSTERMRGLYLYVVMRAITFRRLRIPLPRLMLGDPV